MTFRVVLLRKAEEDLDRVTAWLAERSPRGAARWLSLFQETIARLEQNPSPCALAPENDYVQPEVRQAIFSTRRGLPYRVLFTIAGAEVRILRIRGSGQDLLHPGEM